MATHPDDDKRLSSRQTITIVRDELPPLQVFNFFNKIPLHLVLHFDINETILLGDEAGGDTREDVLNKMLAKSAFVRMEPTPASDRTNEDEDTGECSMPLSYKEHTSKLVPKVWWNGDPIYATTPNHCSPPPLYTKWKWPNNCCPYYRTSYKRQSKTFVHHRGKNYKPLYDMLESKLTQNHLHETHPVLPHILPAFWETLQELSRRQTKLTLVLRTMGSDLHDIAQCLSLFATGKHPDYPNFHNENLILRPDQLYRGVWTRQPPHVYQLWQADELVASGDDAVVALIQSQTVCGIQDDYQFWKMHGCAPWAGKPVWIPSNDSIQHVLFDDNIHNLEHDGIASVRKQQHDDSWETLSGAQILEQHGKHLIRTPTIEPALNPRWFVEQIDAAMERVRQSRDHESS
ncbi:hypothetical protein MPSEU_000969600 [Mayamaea pseudoterrestris]|nr:hypothetical protein MPSEU_000969600 [Mayamaea pseudoterrestris]